MNLTNEEVLNLAQALNSVGNLSGVKFSYCVARNLDIVGREIKVIQEAIKQSKEFGEYETKRVELAKKYSKKDDKGKEVIEISPDGKSSQFVLADEKSFNKELEALRKENKKVLEARDKQIAEFDVLLKEKSDIKLYMVDLEFIPKEITSKQMNGIFAIINEEKKDGK